MYLQLCEHPLRIKKDGHFRYVPCGKCNTCKCRKSSDVVSRLEHEAQCHKYTVFFTLTYNDSNLPTLQYSSTDNALVDPVDGLVFSLDEIKGFRPNSRLYLARRKEIPYLKVKDLQDFIKRLRFYFSTTISQSKDYAKNCLRYYAVGEYGPSTYRPHFHGVLYFDSDLVARQITHLISKSWPFGFVKAEHSKGRCASYCARYVNCISALPKVYQHRSLRPFSICSKFPSLGSAAIPSQTFYQLLFGGFGKFPLVRPSDNQVVDVQLWRTLESKWFPKVPRFSHFSHNERVTLYGLASYGSLVGFESFNDFLSWIPKLYERYNGSVVDVESFNRPVDNSPFIDFFDTYEHDTNSLTFPSYENLSQTQAIVSTSELYYYLYDRDCTPWLTRILYSLYLTDLNKSVVPKFSRLKKLYYTSCFVVHQCKVLGVSLDFYVSRIEEYYISKELCRLHDFYQFQSDYASDSSPVGLIGLYPDFVDQLKMVHCYDDLKRLELDTKLASFGVFMTESSFFPYSSLYQDFLDELNTIIFLDTSRFTQLSASILNRSRKRKKSNDYLNSVQSEYKFDLLKNYE